VSAVAVAAGSVYEQDAYLEASAVHVGAEIVRAEAAGLALPLLRTADGSRRTVYGLPRPFGTAAPEALAALADLLTADEAPLTAVLSPLAPGPELGGLLRARGLRLAGERAICLTELGNEDPHARFDRRARRAIRTANARGGGARVEPLTPWFGSFYRAAMAALDASPVYHFADPYFEALGALRHYQVTVEDANGASAAALFLHDGREAYYHLGGRRTTDAPLRGAMSLALGEGIREAWRQGCRIVVLGGGRSDDPHDPLLAFKRQLATAAVPRPSLERPGRSS
jgi:hypothetical protein